MLSLDDCWAGPAMIGEVTRSNRVVVPSASRCSDRTGESHPPTWPRLAATWGGEGSVVLHCPAWSRGSSGATLGRRPRGSVTPAPPLWPGRSPAATAKCAYYGHEREYRSKGTWAWECGPREVFGEADCRESEHRRTRVEQHEYHRCEAIIRDFII